jgi:hypothetical protein
MVRPDLVSAWCLGSLHSSPNLSHFVKFLKLAPSET